MTVGETPKTHTGTLGRFRVRFVQTGLIPEAQAVTLARAFQLRQEADYDDGALIQPEQAARLLADVDTFVQAVEPLLQD